MTKLSIIIPTVRRGELLFQTLDAAVKAATANDAEIILVNDNKKEKLILPERFSGIQVTENLGSGAASARNHGVQLSKGNLILFLDDDILIQGHHLQKCFELNEKYPEACFNFNWEFPKEMTAACEKNKFGRFILHVGLINYKGWVPELPWKTDELFEVKALAAFFFLIPKSIFEKTGGFNSNFARQSVEDNEFSHRLILNGTKLFIEPREFVLHNEIDKMDLRARLNRLKTGAFNKRQGEEMGFTEFKIHYSTFKRVSYSILSPIKNIFLFFAAATPNVKLFDPLYRRFAHLLIGIVIFEGYYKKDNSLLR